MLKTNLRLKKYFSGILAALATGLLPAQALAADYFVVLPTGAAKAMAPTPGNEINVSLGAYPLPTLTEGLTYELDFNDLLTVTGDSDYNSTQVNWSVDPAFPPGPALSPGCSPERHRVLRTARTR